MTHVFAQLTTGPAYAGCSDDEENPVADLEAYLDQPITRPLAVPAEQCGAGDYGPEIVSRETLDTLTPLQETP